jgi:hypothetical protein
MKHALTTQQQEAIDLFKNAGLETGVDGKLYLSSGLSYGVGSDIYKNSSIVCITVGRIYSSGAVWLELHWPSGRWETSYRRFKTAEEALRYMTANIGKSIRDVT